MPSVAEVLLKFDGKHVAELESLVEKMLSREGSVDELIALSARNHFETQVGATWLLKRLQESQSEFTELQVKRLLHLLESTTRWEPKLHLLQMLSEFEVHSSDAEGLFVFLKQQVEDESKLVRAWSYNGLFVVGKQYPQYQVEVSRLLKEAELDSAPSVRARVRRLQK